MTRRFTGGGYGPHYYRSMDEKEDYSLRLPIDFRKLAETLDAGNNFGVHRLLSHLLDVRAEKLAEKIARYRERGDDDIAEAALKGGDPLADGIRKLLEDGCY